MAEAQFYLAGAVDNRSIPALIQAVSEQVGKGVRSLLLAISSPGGNIYWGVTPYNFLRGLGVEIITHNVGQVDSIAGVLYSAGDQRFSVPEGRFILHGVSITFSGTNVSISEKDLRSRLAVLEQERDTIASILATRSGKPLADVNKDMLNEIILTAEEAKEYGLVSEIKAEVFDPSQEIVQLVFS